MGLLWGKGGRWSNQEGTPAGEASDRTDKADRVAEELDAALEDHVRAGITGWYKSHGGVRMHRRMSSGLYKKLPAIVDDDEPVIDWAWAQFGRSLMSDYRSGDRHGEVFEGGYLVLTDRRLIALGTGVGGIFSRGLSVIPLDEILQVDFTRNLGEGVVFGAPLRVHTASGESVFRVLPTKVADRMGNWMIEQRNRRAPGATGAGGADPLAQIERMKAMVDSGVLTPDEFEKKKVELLRRL